MKKTLISLFLLVVLVLGMIPLTASAAPEPVQLTVTGTTIANKEYDGTTAATVTIGTVSGYQAGAKLTVTATATFSDKNAGTGKEVTVTYSLSGEDAALYIAPVDENTTANIDPKYLSVAGTTVSDKTYDGNATASVYCGVLEGVVGSDNVTVSATATFDNKNAGNDKSVTVNYTISGVDAANYSLASESEETSASITKRSVTLTSASATKAYDGTPLCDNYVTATGFAGEEGATYECMGSQTEIGSSSNFFEFTLNEGTSPSNYNITMVNGVLTVNPVDGTTLTVDPIPDQLSNGSEIKPAIVIRNGGNVLVENTDYTVSYSNNVNAGTATVTINFIGIYSGTLEKTFVINNPAPINPPTGDTSNVAVWAVILTVSAFAGAAVVIRKKNED